MLTRRTHRENGPAARGAAHAQQRASSRRLARRQRRTGEEGDVAPPEVAFLEVKVELRRRVLCDAVRIFSSLACRTEFERPANVNIISKGILAAFEAPHRQIWKSRSHHHRDRPKMKLPTLSTPIHSRELANHRHELHFPRGHCGTATARPTERTTPSPSGVVRQRCRASHGAHNLFLLAAHRKTHHRPRRKWARRHV